MFEQIGNFGKVVENLGTIFNHIGDAFANIYAIANPVNWIYFADNLVINALDVTSSALLSK
ncbi:hypothetical protein [Corynebacterium hindlerae]|uniref:hypothetical protein n=1 Tax=Corynebacterium hindlerae TaxID=699041 RepID=UPI0031B71508